MDRSVTLLYGDDAIAFLAGLGQNTSVDGFIICNKKRKIGIKLNCLICGLPIIISNSCEIMVNGINMVSSTFADSFSLWSIACLITGVLPLLMSDSFANRANGIMEIILMRY